MENCTQFPKASLSSNENKNYELTLSRFINPSSWTINSRRLSWSADMRNSSSSFRCRSNFSSANSWGFCAICAADLDASSCSSLRRRISLRRSLWENDSSGEKLSSNVNQKKEPSVHAHCFLNERTNRNPNVESFKTRTNISFSYSVR